MRLYALISREERSQEDFSIDGCNGDGVIEYDSIQSFFYLFDVILRNLKKSLSEKDVVRIKTRVEAYSLVCYIHSTTQKNFVTQSARKTFNKLFIRQKVYL
jgi:uncharacterized protein with NAD-binding domain and iron-sulfur cluster